MTTSRVIPVAAALLLTLAACAGVTSTSMPTLGKGTARAPGTKGVQTGDINRRQDPCVDFDEFASGTYRKENPIPPHSPRWSRRVAGREAIKGRLRDILQEVSAKRDWPAGSVEKLLGDHYTSCMDEASVDAAGLAPLAPLLAEIAGARSVGDVERAIRRLHDLSVAVPFGLNGAMDYEEPSRFVASVVAGNLGLSDRDGYLKGDAGSIAARESYRAHVARVLELRGMPKEQTAKAADAVLALETRLAEASLDGTTAADPAKTDHRTTFAELQELAPHVDWALYFSEAGLPRGDLNVAEPRLLQQVDSELTATPVETWRSYLTFQLLESASPWLSRPFVEESYAFKGKATGAAVEIPPRALRCVESTESLLGDALGEKYVARYFPPEAKAKLEEMARALLAVLEEEVPRLDWMAPETKKKALEQLATYDVQVGYPGQWKDYAALTIRRDAFWANVAAARAFNVSSDRRRVGNPTARDLWLVPQSAPFGYIDFQRNQIVMPAGALQSSAFDVTATDAVNYGAIGAGLAHDLTHAIDTLGDELDAQGRPHEWWTATDLQKFHERAQCTVDQFEGYFIEPGVHEQGKLVESESVADLAGVHLSYLALERSMKKSPVPTVDGFTPEQQFFLSFAQFRAEDVRLEAQRQMVKDDIHPVARFRVIGTLSNSVEFQRAFSCPAGAAMVRPPETRCAIW